MLRPSPAALVAVLGSLVAALPAQDQAGAGPQRPRAPASTRLDNGVTVLARPVPGLGQVAVLAFYPVGFLHEPAGMPQAAHLLEHLACMGATRSFPAGASLARLQELGMANAETLQHVTRFDYVLPSGELELALRVEAERLESLAIDEELIHREGPRCAAEVEQAGGMAKFAFAAYHQAWRYGKTRARVREGLDAYSVAAMEGFRRAVYRPEKLTLVLFGDFDQEQALALAARHPGAVKAPEDARPGPPGPIDWSRVPKDATVRWDGPGRALCLAYPPPEDALGRVALTLWGATVQMRLAMDGGLKQITDHFVSTPGPGWNVGELPFFFHVDVKDGVALEKAEEILAGRVEALIRQGTTPEALALSARQLAAQAGATGAAFLRRHAGDLQRRLHLDEGRALGMVAGNVAIQWWNLYGLLGPDPDATIAALEAMDGEALRALFQEHLAPQRRIVTRLVPEEAQEH